MTPEMIHSFERNGQVLIVDSTHGTNHFAFPLTAVVGVNENGKRVILAAAFMRQQRAVDFQWMFESIKQNVSTEVWAQIRTVALDGDQAMMNAVKTCMPDAYILRCVFHLQLNVRHRCLQLDPIPTTAQIDAFVAAWQSIVYNAQPNNFDALKKAFHDKPEFTAFQPVFDYLDKELWPHRDDFLYCYMNEHVHFDVHSTSLVEGTFRWLKARMKAQADLRRMPLLAVCKILEQTAVAREVDDGGKEIIEERKTNAIEDGSFDKRVNEALTGYAAARIITQHRLYDFYRCTRKGDHYECERTSGTKRIVSVTRDSMNCSCQEPTFFLLPCRHVLSANVASGFGSSFLKTQCAKRWWRDFQRPQRVIAAAALVADSLPDQNENDSLMVIDDAPQVDVFEGRTATKAHVKQVCTEAINSLVDGITANYHAKLVKIMESLAQLHQKPTAFNEVSDYLDEVLDGVLDPEVASRRGQRRKRLKGEMKGKNLPKQGPRATEPRPNPNP